MKVSIVASQYIMYERFSLAAVAIFSSAISVPFDTREMRITLAAGTIVHHLVREDIAIDAEVVLTRLALIAARFTCALSPFCLCTAVIVFVCVVLSWWSWKWGKAAVALRASSLSRASPWYLDPVP